METIETPISEKNDGNIFDHKKDTIGIILSPISGL